MQTILKFDSHVPPHPGVPFETHHAVVKELLASNQAQAKRFIREAKRVERIEQDYQAQLLQLMGKNKYKRFREYVAKENQTFAEKLRPSKGTGLSREEIRQLSSQRREASLAFMDSFGVKADELKALDDRFMKRVTKRGISVSKQSGKPDQPALPPPIPPMGGSPSWSLTATITPPYGGYNWYAYYYYDGSMHIGEAWDVVQQSADVTDFVETDPQTGFVGSYGMPMYNYVNWLDRARGSAVIYSAVGFWHQMKYPRPTSSTSRRRLSDFKVSIEAENVHNHHHIDVNPAHGSPLKHSDVSQENRLTFKVEGRANVALPTTVCEDARLMSCEYEHGTGEAHFDDSYWQIGAIATPELRSAGYPPGSWVWIQVGTRSNWDTSATDLWVYSDMDFGWKIKSVKVFEML
jgi:hypothetical protein